MPAALPERCDLLRNTPNSSLPGFSGNGVVGAPGARNFTIVANFGKINSTRDNPNGSWGDPVCIETLLVRPQPCRPANLPCEIVDPQ